MLEQYVHVLLVFLTFRLSSVSLAGRLLDAPCSSPGIRAVLAICTSVGVHMAHQWPGAAIIPGSPEMVSGGRVGPPSAREGTDVKALLTCSFAGAHGVGLCGSVEPLA